MEISGYDPSSYGDGLADVYDDWFAGALDTDGAVGCLAPMAKEAGGGAARVLELGVGTGRIALPLAGEGLQVTGIDASSAMLEAMAAKPGGDGVKSVLGDMAELSALGEGRFDLVFVAWNSLFNLTSIDAQRRCFAQVATRLASPAARFVVEGFVPGDVGTRAPDTVEVRSMTTESVVLAISRHEPASQQVAGHYVQFSEAGGVRLRPWHLHYLTPGQLDTLATEAGMRLLERWSGWAAAPFDSEESAGHVSVYALADEHP